MGFRPGITRQQWKEAFDRQDIPAMLEMLHRFEVKPGETYLIHGGVPHAIGAGCLLIEIQEPTDYTVRTEKVTPSGLEIDDFMCHQGLGFEKMLDVFRYEGLTLREVRARWVITPKVLRKLPSYTQTELVGYGQTPCFRMDRYDIRSECVFKSEGRFSGIYLFEGEGWLEYGSEKRFLKPGDQYFVPAVSGNFKIRVQKPISLFRCFGPCI